MELVVGDVGEFGTVVLGDDELAKPLAKSWLSVGLKRSYRVTVAERLDIEKGEGLVTLKELQRWNVACSSCQDRFQVLSEHTDL